MFHMHKFRYSGFVIDNEPEFVLNIAEYGFRSSCY